MKKDVTRDYTTEIFRAYAAAGFPTYEQERERVYKRELAKRQTMNTEAAVIQAETAIEKKTPYLLDILSAERTFEILNNGGKRIIVEAVKAVYCAYPLQTLHRGDITDRVNRFALTCPADVSTVYRWLKEARLLCAAIRGLRISDEELQWYEINFDDTVCE